MKTLFHLAHFSLGRGQTIERCPDGEDSGLALHIRYRV